MRHVPDMEENRVRGERLRQARKAAGLSVDQVARRAGYSSSGVRAIENGQNGLRADAAQKFAPILGTSASWLLTGDGDGAGAALVPVIGRVGADNEGTVIYATADATGDMAPIPPGGDPHSVALEVVGHSMRGFADHGALIYFQNQHTPPTADMLGNVVIVATDDDRILLKRLLKGSGPGVYDLESQVGPTISDVRLRWAAEITAIVPARHAQRIIRRRGEAA
jgi:transcriptional regulator with XRE-family HTH domain